MSEINDLELFYILPYTKSYDSGGYYRSDETCSIVYRSPSESIQNGKSKFFDDKDKLLKWFYKNADNLIPKVYRIKYIANYKGFDDVFKITNLGDGNTKYYTALNKNTIICYDVINSESLEKYVWNYSYVPNQKDRFILKDIYKEFYERGIKIKYNVYEKIQEQNIDKKDCFEFIGNPFNSYGQKEITTKKLILCKV